MEWGRCPQIQLLNNIKNIPARESNCMNYELIKVVSDMDGVFANSQVPVVGRFNREFKTSITVADWTKFDLLTELAMKLSGESVAVVGGWLFAVDVMMEAQPFPDSQQVIRELSEMGIQLAVCTSRPADQAIMTLEWMKQYFPEITNVYVRNGDNPGLRGNDFKLQTVVRLGATHYFEDDGAVVEGVTRLQESGLFPTLQTPTIFDRPWNDQLQFPPSVLRVGDWKNGDYGWPSIKKAILGGRN